MSRVWSKIWCSGMRIQEVNENSMLLTKLWQTACHIPLECHIMEQILSNGGHHSKLIILTMKGWTSMSKFCTLPQNWHHSSSIVTEIQTLDNPSCLRQKSFFKWLPEICDVCWSNWCILMKTSNPPLRIFKLSLVHISQECFLLTFRN